MPKFFQNDIISQQETLDNLLKVSHDGQLKYTNLSAKNTLLLMKILISCEQLPKLQYRAQVSGIQ